MRIAGLYPQHVDAGPQGEIEFFEPLGLEYVLAQVASGRDVGLFTLFDKTEEQAVREVIDFKPDVLAVSSMTPQINLGLKMTGQIKERLPGLFTVFGGYHPSFDCDLVKRDEVDFCISGEGELAFKQLVEVLENEGNVSSIPGLTFRAIDDTVVHNPSRRISNLDELKDPLRPNFLLQIRDNCLIYPAPSQQTGLAQVSYSRGCKFNCNFCTSPGMYGQTISYRSPQRVVGELARLQERGVNTFFFTDLNITANHDKVRELCAEISKSGKSFYWNCLSNISTADDFNLLREMKEAGCTKIGWGIETFDKDIQGEIGKVGLSKSRRVLQMAEDLGILNTGFYILGHPRETKEKIRGYLPELVSLPLHRIRFTVYTPLPGSRLFANSQGLDKNWDNYDTTHLVFQHSSLSQEDLDRLRVELTEGFYASGEHKARVKRMVERFPYLKTSFQEGR